MESQSLAHLKLGTPNFDVELTPRPSKLNQPNSVINRRLQNFRNLSTGQSLPLGMVVYPKTIQKKWLTVQKSQVVLVSYCLKYYDILTRHQSQYVSEWQDDLDECFVVKVTCSFVEAEMHADVYVATNCTNAASLTNVLHPTQHMATLAYHLAYHLVHSI